MVSLLDPRDLRLLDGLRLAPRKSFAGKVRGERLTRRAGISIEFADYRDYVEGDDLRHLDWNVFARLESPVMKTYRDEEDLALHLLIDQSPSMEFGTPSKAEAAKDWAAAFGYLGLMGGDAVQPRVLGGRSHPIGTLRGRAGFGRLNSWLSVAENSSSGLYDGIRGFANTGSRPGVAVVLSDGLDPEASSAVRLLGGRGHEVWFFQILSAEDIDPEIEGDLRLMDAESDSFVEITANGAVLKEYKARLAQHNDELAGEVRKVGGRYALVRSDGKVPEVIRDVLKREGWVQ